MARNGIQTVRARQALVAAALVWLPRYTSGPSGEASSYRCAQ